MPTLEWALLLAVVALAGHAVYRGLGLPRMVGYTLVGGLAGWLGFSGATWPMHGVGLFLLQLGMTVVLFEAGTRLPIRWFLHNPMVLVQSLLEAVLTFALTFLLLRWWGEPASVARMVAMVALAASPATLLRLVHELRAAGPVTDRALVLASLNNLYALVLGGAMAAQSAPDLAGWAAVWPPLRLLGTSLLLAVVLAAVIHLAWRTMRHGSESAAVFIVAILAASVTVADQLHGSAPLVALMAGAMLRYAPVRPMVWQRHFEGVSGLLVMLMFVLVATTAAQMAWSVPILLIVFSLVLVRVLCKVLGVVAGSWRSGMGPVKCVWLGLALMPMSATALLLTTQFASQHPQAARMSAIALPLILVCEVLGAVCAAFALRAARETVQVANTPAMEGRHDA
ncbi:cation:proton antiporter [Comamonas serinivorans]|uniref:cation:proton antiporter n=1 Tax=Comamonas serinivorans TaxID=1082851 RepID=UPI001F15839F|nr:cation:proton antiporter [Comamonas serinivorans]